MPNRKLPINRNPRMRRPAKPPLQTPAVSQNFRNAVLAAAIKKLRDPIFLELIQKPAGWHNGSRLRGTFKFRGREIMLKDTKGTSLHGFYFGKIRQAILIYKRGIRSGQIVQTNSRIQSIPIYGRIGNYLVMPFVAGENQTTLAHSPQLPLPVRESLKQASEEVRQNFSILNYREFPKLPQVLHSIVHTSNPTNPQAGVWTFYIPYDFG